ncbi:S1C family serine protease [Paenibacillus rigui]|uniref:Serine protease n=1 Tax=Paenibacillus rigui TaxID=554312 RepID=A0A229UMA5_9BACL|nr:trypsin-like peptidase domain-containing protein [Paenibacillus rigui]OXM84556.1 serine protease [Paenibacillus rigui]
MSLFDDDFYSTKVSRWDQWSPGGWRRKAPWIWPALGGAVVMLGVVLLFSVGTGSKTVETAAAISPSAPAASGAIAPGDAHQLASDSVVRMVEKVGPTVVSIIGSQKEGEKASPRGGTRGLGSGVIFQKEGDKVRIVTNNHVVEGFNQLDVVTSAGEQRKATLLGRDQMTDLAVLEMDGSGIKQVAEFGDSRTLKAGQTAVAFGNPLGLGYAPTITQGIISWPKRTIPVSLGQQGEYDWEMDVIQTDAAINQGNSGGALVNLDGKVIGINTLKVADMGVEGLGFAIPITEAKPVIDTLISEHKIKRPYIGVVTQDLQSFAGTEVLKLPADVKTGIIVLDATGPAKEKGLKTNDVIVELDGKPVSSTLALRKYIYGQKQIGDSLSVTYYRGSKKSTLTLNLAELKDR